MRLAGGAHQPLAGQLGLAVRAQRRARGLLGDQFHVGHAVHGGGGGEEEVADAGGGHRPQQDLQALNVLVVVVQRLLDGLADLLLAGQVHHAGDLVPEDGLVQVQPVQDRADHQRDALRDAVLVARGEVVVDDDLLTCGDHRADDVGADVAGATSDQKSHAYLPGDPGPSPGACPKSQATLRVAGCLTPIRGLPGPGGDGCVRGSARPRHPARASGPVIPRPCGTAAPAEHRTCCSAAPGGAGGRRGGAER